ncbi:MAG: glycosyltransferase [Verrucomicrobiaceae bacterium]|nr:MAG: glycosyltransferase [Verrucomicrobiaceae bacterium]
MTLLLTAAVLLWAVGFILLTRLRDGKNTLASAHEDAARAVCLIIPARNEAHNLPQLLESIAAQSVKPGEVIVVDDGSTDETAAIARRHGAMVLESAPLPAGWRGKTWACHQGAAAASGGLLLFMDADTWFEPDGFERLLAAYQGGALSVSPYHAVRNVYESLSLFFNICMTVGTVPDGLAGQFLLACRSAYQASGGHEAVRGKVLENFRLASELRKTGAPVRTVIGRNLVSFRMYPDGPASLIEGWTKGFAAGAGGTPGHVLFLVVAWMTGLMLPPLCLAITADWQTWLPLYLLCAAQVGWLARKLGAFHWCGILFYPLPLVFFFGLFGWSALRSGKKVTWKGREIDAD